MSRFVVRRFDGKQERNGIPIAECPTMYEAKALANAEWTPGATGIRQSLVDEATGQEWCRIDGEQDWHFARRNEE